MSESKQYPLTENKKKELRKQGIVPYSSLVIKSALLSGTFILFSRLISSESLTGINAEKNFWFQEYMKKNVSEILLSGQYGSLEITFYSLLLMVFLLALGLIQTAFLFIRLGKYPDGIRHANRKNTIKKVCYNFVSALLVLLVLSIPAFFSAKNFLTSSAASSVGIAHSTNDALKHSFLSFLTVAIGPLIQLLEIFALILLVICVSSFIISKIRYFMTHQMSRDEILAEGEKRKTDQLIG